MRSLELARERLAAADVEWMRARKPAARRDGVQCWHGGPRNAVHEYVGKSNAAACLATQRAPLGLVAPHPPRGRVAPDAAGRAAAARIRVGEPLHLAAQVAAQPGRGRRTGATRGVGWFADLDRQAADGAFWLLLDLDERTATWRRAPYDPAPARSARTCAGDRRRLTQRGRSKRAK